MRAARSITPRSTPLALTRLEERETPAVRLLATGAGAGGAPHVQVYNPDGSHRLSFFAYTPTFYGGVRVATADVTSDGFDDIITVPASNGGPHVRVFNGVNGALVAEYFAYDPNQAVGMFVAAGDVNGDGRAEVVVSRDTYPQNVPPGQYVRTLATVRILEPLTGAPATNTVGTFTVSSYAVVTTTLAVGNVQGDGRAEIILGQPSGLFTSQTTYQQRDTVVYSGTGQLLRSMSILNSLVPTYYPGGGISIFTDYATRYISAGDVNGDGYADLAVGYSGVQGGTSVRIVNIAGGGPLIRGPFNPFPGWGSEVRTALKDLDGDGRAELVTGVGPGGGPAVKVFRGLTGAEYMSFFAYTPGFTGGVWVG
jgi:hypothetical protein